MQKVSLKYVALGGLLFISFASVLISWQIFDGSSRRPDAIQPAPLDTQSTVPANFMPYGQKQLVQQQQARESSVQKKQPGRMYPITDGKTYQIVPGRQYKCEEGFWDDSRYVEILQIRSDGKWKEVYRTKDEGDGNCYPALVIREDYIFVSPLNGYVQFSVVGWEWSEVLLVNTKTKKQVLEKDTLIYGSLEWSKDARDYAFISHTTPFPSGNYDGIWVSQYKNPDKPKLIFNLETWKELPEDQIYWTLYGLNNLHFLDNKTIEFSISKVSEHNSSKFLEELAHYRYDLEKEKLTEIFQK